jgi:hypothetical protein
MSRVIGCAIASAFLGILIATAAVAEPAGPPTPNTPAVSTTTAPENGAKQDTATPPPAPQSPAPDAAAKQSSPSAAEDTKPPEFRPAPQWFILSAIILVYVSVIGAFLMIRNSLRTTGTWHLGDALAEEAEITNDAGVAITKMMPSTSRLIAFFGLIALLILFLGFGIFALYSVATGHEIQGINSISKFLLTGMSLFAPYAVNQARAAIESLSAPPVSAPPKVANPPALSAAKSEGGC